MPLLSMSQDGEIYEIDRDFNEVVYGRGAKEVTESDVMIGKPSLLSEQLLAQKRRENEEQRAKEDARKKEQARVKAEAKAFDKRRKEIAQENRDMAMEGLMGDDPLLQEAVLSSFGSPADFSVTNFDRNGLSPIGEPDYSMQMGFEPPQGSLAGDAMGDWFSDQRDALLKQAGSDIMSTAVQTGTGLVQKILMPAPTMPAAPAPVEAAPVPMPSSAQASAPAGGVPFMSKKVAGIPMPLVLGGGVLLVLGGMYAIRKR